MRFDESDLRASQPGQRPQGTHLRHHHAANLGRRHRDHTAPKTLAVGIAGVRADPNAPLGRQAQRLEHCLGVAGMAAAGDIGAGDAVQDLRVIAQHPRAVAFTEVGVQIDLHGCVICREDWWRG